MASFGGVESIVVGRYDGHTSPDNGYVTRRIHQEDLPSHEYHVLEGNTLPTATPLLPTSWPFSKDTEGNGARRFTDALLFNYLTTSTDAHAKNYSLLHPSVAGPLAPLYDVAGAALRFLKGRPYHLAMSIGGENTSDS